MTYADAFNIRTQNVTFNLVADAIDGVISRTKGGTTTGSSNTYAASPSPTWAAYSGDNILTLVPNFTNTGAATLNVNSLGLKAVRYKNRALVGGELVSGVPALFMYDGTFMQLLNHGGGWASYTPSYGAYPSMTYTSVTTNRGRFQLHGSTMLLQAQCSGTTGGSPSSGVTIGIPSGFTLADSYVTGVGAVQDGGAVIGANVVAFGTTDFLVQKYDSSNFGLGAGRVAYLNVTVEVA